MRFLGSKFAQNALVVGLRPGPRWGAKALPRPLADFRGPLRGRGKGKEGKEGGGKAERSIGEGKEGGRERKRGRRERGRRREGRRGGVCVIGVRGDRRPCHAQQQGQSPV